MELREAMKQAAAAVEEAGLPEDLRQIAFKTALDSLLGVGQATSGAATPPPVATSAVMSDDRLGMVASKLGMSVEDVAEVIHCDESAADIVVGYSRLASGKAAGVRQIALLICAARQASGLDPDGWTATSAIRDVAKEFNKFDEANFAGTLKEMDKEFNFQGSGAGRKLRLTRKGWEDVKALVAELTGGGAS